jgi:putative transposase
MMLDDYPHQSNLRKGRFSETGRAYSLTKCTATGISLTDDPLIAKSLIDALFWMDSQDRFRLGAFVVMPDHHHVVIALNSGYTLPGIMKPLGSCTAREINRISGSSGGIWQEGYYDRGIRKMENILEIFEYIHHNPVRKGLVSRADEWPYSSLNRTYYERIRWEFFM